jgi:hypothetical protein
MQQPFPKRSTVYENPETLEIKIPSQKDWLLTLLLTSVFIVAVLLVIFFVSTFLSENRSPSRSTSPFVFILGLIMFGGSSLVFFNALVWIFFGFEITQFRSESVSIAQCVFSLKKEWLYSSIHITRLRTLQIPEFSRTDQSSVWIRGPSSLAFDYGAKTIRFGRGIDEAEAAQVLERVFTKFPQYQPQPAASNSPSLHARP